MEKFQKEYKVTYKTYYNERLKKSPFHNKLMHPLYVQVTFDRIPIIFKSYYYDLFSKPKYAIPIGTIISIPDIKDIIKKETILIEFIINKNLENFSLDLFKKEYAFYCRDLADIMEEGFIDYLFIFFNDKGMPSLATAIKEGCRFRLVYDIVADMKYAFNKTLYNELIENSLYFAPPYMPIYGYIEQIKNSSLKSLTVLDWQDEKIKEEFTIYFHSKFGIDVPSELIRNVGKFIRQDI